MFGMQSGWAVLYDADWAKDHVTDSCGSGRYIFMCNCGVNHNGSGKIRNMQSCDKYASSPSYSSNCKFAEGEIDVKDRTWSSSSGCKNTSQCDTAWMICATASSSYVDACEVCGCNDTSDTIDGTWVSWKTGVVVSSVVKQDGYGKCRIVDPGYGEAAVKYGCNSGYYYTSGSLDSTECTQCPTISETSTDRGTSDVGNTSGITGCYLPSGKNYNDNIGTYQFTSKCKYSK